MRVYLLLLRTTSGGNDIGSLITEVRGSEVDQQVTSNEVAPSQLAAENVYFTPRLCYI